MHQDTEALIALSNCDTAVEALEGEYRTLVKTIKAAEHQLTEATANHDITTGELSRLRDEENKHNRRYKTYLKRVATTKNLIDSGKAGDYEAAMSQLSLCNGIVDEEETHLLELFEQIEQCIETCDSAEKLRAHRALQVDNRQSALDNRLPGLRGEVNQARAARDKAKESVPNHHLYRYDTIKKKGLTAVSPVYKNACGLCNMEVTAVTLAEHRRGSVVHWCKSCGRFYGADIEFM
jgi:predicted  nucleic acid-binding Zn-ribbon protein